MALYLLGLFSFSALCLAQSTVSIISVPPTPVLSSSSSAFTPNSPSSSFDSLGTASSTSPTTTIYGITEQTFPPTFTSCFIPPTGTVSTTQSLDATLSLYPAGAECLQVIRASGHVIEAGLFTVAEDGETLPVSVFGSAPTSTSSSSSSPPIGTGSIVGAVIGSVLGAFLVVVTLFWIRKQRRSSKPVGSWLNRPAGWVRDEKQPTHAIEMSRRDDV